MKKMKKTAFLILLLCAFTVIFSCKNSETKDNENKDSTENVVVEKKIENKNDVNKQNTTKEPTTKIKAKFEMVSLGSDGAWYSFTDEKNKDYLFFDDGNQQVHNMFSDAEPNTSSKKYENIWFEVEYISKTLQFYDGGEGKNVDRNVEIITSIKKIDDNSTTKSSELTLDEIIATSFGGTEPFWSIKFSKTGAKFNAYPDAPEIILTYGAKKANGNSFSITADDHENMESYFITIKKESCSDGMSDNTYPYSIEIKRDNSILNGCGWKK